MYLQQLTVEGFKGFGNPFTIGLANGLNILVGENGVGKSAIIDAIRIILHEDEYGRSGASEHDFYQPFQRVATVSTDKKIRINAQFMGLSQEEQVAFLPWSVHGNAASLSLQIEPTPKGRNKTSLWGGVSSSSIFEWELMDTISCIYLPPLRDAEARLRDGRGSRLARLLLNLNYTALQQHMREGTLHPLESKVKAFNEELASDGNECIANANNMIRLRLEEAVGEVFSQSTKIQFAEVNFARIAENLRLLFFPEVCADLPIESYRHITENSLGYNNILYLATVMAEMTPIPSEPEYLRILLIEEPEAHLHPQLQMRLLKFLQTRANETGMQVVVTTHSPVLASAVSIDSVIHLSCPTRDNAVATPLRKCGLPDPSQSFINRWLDATKSTLLFAKGVILVEGLAEAMLLPVLAQRVLQGYRQQDQYRSLPKSLEDAGISIINMNGIYFKHFMQLFCDVYESENLSIPVRCAGITDNDPPSTAKPTPSNPVPGENPALELVTRVNASGNCRLFGSRLKTFEYDLAMEQGNLKVMAALLLRLWPAQTGSVVEELTAYSSQDWTAVTDENAKADAAFKLLQWIGDSEVGKGLFAQSLADELASNEAITLAIPDYLVSAINWAVGCADARA